MDIFHDNAMLAGVRQMLGAFAKQYIRPVAMQHDRDESIPWALMKQAQAFGMTQTVAAWARDQRARVSVTTIGVRLRRGMSPEDAITRKPFKA